VFLVCGEPRTLLTDSARYLTPADAAQAGYEAVASMSETPERLLSRKAAATAGMSCGPMMPIVVTARLDLLDMAVLLSWPS
jgi:hypothetical protein